MISAAVPHRTQVTVVTELLVHKLSFIGALPGLPVKGLGCPRVCPSQPPDACARDVRVSNPGLQGAWLTSSFDRLSVRQRAPPGYM